MSESYTFTSTQDKKIADIFTRYPKDQRRSALMPILWLLQEDNGGWLTQSMIEAIADLLQMEALQVQEVVSFYSMFHTSPVGTYHVQVCRTLSCKLRGSAGIYQACRQQLNLTDGELSADGKFALSRVECLGCCANAPVVQINKDIYEDLSPEKMVEVLQNLQEDKSVKAGSAIGRVGSKPWSSQKQAKKVRNVKR